MCMRAVNRVNPPLSPYNQTCKSSKENEEEGEERKALGIRVKRTRTKSVSDSFGDIKSLRNGKESWSNKTMHI